MVTHEKDDSISKADQHKGLTTTEVEFRLKKYGANELPVPEKHLFTEFLKKFWEPSSWMLELILIISIFLEKFDDLFLVTALLVINDTLSFYLERRAFQVVEALQKKLEIRVRVLRNSLWSEISAKSLVPGDIVRIRAGDFIPADLVIQSGKVDVDQSALTGESIDLHFGANDHLISGSIVRRGEAQAIVHKTGSFTKFGQTAALIERASPRLHIQQVVIKVVGWLCLVVVTMMAVVAILAVVRGTALIETLPILLILLMGAIPISLPVMFTVCLSVGSKDLSKHGVLVTRLSAVEDAATMSQLCIDKTGTITLNQLHIVDIIAFGTHTDDEVVFAGAMASQESNQDPIDNAFLSEYKIRSRFKEESTFQIISFSPFDSATRSTQAKVRTKGHIQFVMKGAVDCIVKACLLDSPQVHAISQKVEELAGKGYRVLAVSQGLSESSLDFLGLVALFDPPRPDAKKFIEQIKNLGVSLKMLTGDALMVAKELSSRVGLGEILPFKQFTSEIPNLNASSDNLMANCGGFAEVLPENKYQVVKSLQSLGFVTGMTGDGANDAPALRQAEVGIAVSGSTDIARSAASIVLTEPGLINIVYLIQYGRIVYQRLLTWIINKISRTILKTPYVAIAYIVTDKFVVSAFAMLLLVLVTDATKIALATDIVRPSSRPENWEINGYLVLAIVLGLLMLSESLLLLWFGWNYLGLSSNDESLNTFSFLLLLYMAAFSILSVRERLHFWSTKPGNILLSAFVFEIVAGTALVNYGLKGMAPLPWMQTIGIFTYSMLTCLFLNDFIKHAVINRFALNSPLSASKLQV